MGGELAVEFPKQRNAIRKAKLGAGGAERGIRCRRGAVDDETRAGQRLEYRREGRIAQRIMRPGEARAQRQQDGRVERHQVKRDRVVTAGR